MIRAVATFLGPEFIASFAKPTLAWHVQEVFGLNPDRETEVELCNYHQLTVG